MKFSAALLGFTLMAGAVLADTAPAVGSKAPAAKATTPAAKKDDAKKPEPPPKIPGTEILRPNGTFLGLEVVNGNFKLTFYDKKRKPMAADVTRVNARWPNRRSATPAEYRTVLNGTGNSLVGSRPVLPPFGFTVYLTLLRGEGENPEVVESYQVAFRG